jgi:hypothetical protein
MLGAAAFGEMIEEHIEFIAENVSDAGDRLVQNAARQDVFFEDGAGYGPRPSPCNPFHIIAFR